MSLSALHLLLKKTYFHRCVCVGVVQQLKEQLNQSHAKLDYEKHQHLLEVSQMQRKLRFEQEKHEREAEQVFREVVRERDSLKAEVLYTAMLVRVCLYHRDV